MSKLFSLSQRDWIHGLVMTIIGAGLTTLLQIIESGGLNLTQEDWKVIATGAVIAGMSYLQKKFFSDEDGKLGGKL